MSNYRVFKGIRPMIYAWAIRQKSTGAYLPARKNGRGYSFDEPGFGFPRLFKSERSARNALTAWLQGEWKLEWHTKYDDAWGPDDYQTLVQNKVETRDASDMEIVKFLLVEQE
jgi:hypothetical protein